MQDKILDMLKRQTEYVSGEEMSSRLSVSRQALWKHVQELRDAGYDIVAVPHLGYRLISSPDRLFPAEVSHGLKTRLLGKEICYFESAYSTMDVAGELGAKGYPEGTIVVAETQTKGRGRMGRFWSSPKYKGIYFSLLIRPRILPNATPVLTLLAAVSVCEAVKEVTGLEAKIKWPNDIMLGNRKLGGILTELNAETDTTHFVVIGIGINVNNDKRHLVEGAVSLREEKKEEVSRLRLLQEMLVRLEHNYSLFQGKGGEAIVSLWRLYSSTLGRRVKVVLQKAHLEGEAVGIEADGGLLVRRDCGLTEKVMAGDVVYSR